MSFYKTKFIFLPLSLARCMVAEHKQWRRHGGGGGGGAGGQLPPPPPPHGAAPEYILDKLTYNLYVLCLTEHLEHVYMPI